MPPRTPIYQLRVSHAGSSPPIWRKLLVPGNPTLNKLHRMLQLAFEWENYHLHQFVVGEDTYSTPHPEDWREVKDDRKARLNRILTSTGEELRYEYDFGDGWARFSRPRTY